MAFKSMKEIESNRYRNLFHLDDGKSLNGVFLYHDYEEVLIAEAHYIKTSEYSGYVHCTGAGCPACRKGIRVQRKLFIPIFVPAQLNSEYDNDTIVFWDRNEGFMHQLKRDVFDKSPYPTDTVYRITRHGAYRDINTTYSISARYHFNNSIDNVLTSMNASFPDYYEVVIKDLDSAALEDLLDSGESEELTSSLPTRDFNYSVTPRRNANLDLDSIESLTDLDTIQDNNAQVQASETNLVSRVDEGSNSDSVENLIDAVDDILNEDSGFETALPSIDITSAEPEF